MSGREEPVPSKRNYIHEALAAGPSLALSFDAQRRKYFLGFAWAAKMRRTRQREKRP